MPTYEYLCQTCSHRFETWQKMTDEPLTVCPECGNHIRRVLFPAGVVFKGSGFYKTDYSQTKTLASSNGDAKKAEGNGESKSSSESGSSSSEKSSGTSASNTPAASK
ncbi:FmdB family transcriptional regulator [Dictyobacter sp. S3.2.2.5]|uniref:FmdB family transcriptional regulator n=1 Tax=Dictyobacter halimunensis TaxID=3026934 RepID=A0ABQ6FYS9_9CHLR|nr:FmdB family transcriptional regulator [Dictyobacter sp. S3.2.2.5]